MSDDAIVVEGLVKRYRRLLPLGESRTVLDGMALRVPTGGVHGLLGPNGAGKTTVIRVLLGLARPTAGRVQVLGHDAWRDSAAVRRRLSHVPAERALFDWMRVGRFVDGVAALSPAWDDDCAARLRRRWELDPRATMRELSTGARSRLMLLVALARRSPLLVLDEPTTGLDPAAVDDALAEIVGAAADGATILLVTHRLDEVDRICDRVTMMDGGRAVLDADLEQLRASWSALDVAGDVPSGVVRQWDEVAAVRAHGEHQRVLVRAAPDAVAERIRQLGGEVTGLRLLTLREIYLASTRASLTGNPDDAAHDDLA